MFTEVLIARESNPHLLIVSKSSTIANGIILAILLYRKWCSFSSENFPTLSIEFEQSIGPHVPPCVQISGMFSSQQLSVLWIHNENKYWCAFRITNDGCTIKEFFIIVSTIGFLTFYKKVREFQSIKCMVFVFQGHFWKCGSILVENSTMCLERVDNQIAAIILVKENLYLNSSVELLFTKHSTLLR